jgi:hypothetical protein
MVASSQRKRRVSYSWCSIPNSFRACSLRKLFSHRDFPVQLAVRAVGPLQGGESSSVSDFRTVYALLGPKIVKLAAERSDDVGLPSIQLQKGRHRCSGKWMAKPVCVNLDPLPTIQIAISSTILYCCTLQSTTNYLGGCQLNRHHYQLETPTQ